MYDKAKLFLNGYAVVVKEYADGDGNKEVEWGIIIHSEK